ncbi:hypothetical protein [Flagellimonas aquimarina]|uniref:hypothetical protein n=1 Tax=Flagellimonas aquimarina TaxID=2201895 RepID=UPI0010581D97|nr:hypothetical protein [Allomuricauda koreensis]
MFQPYFSKISRYCGICFLSFLFLFISCKDGKKETSIDKIETEQEAKDISELSYQEIFYLLHDEDEYGVDYHGEVFGQDASKKISLISTSSNTCGDKVVLQSSEGQLNITAAVKVSFSFPGNSSQEIHRLYTVKPGETVPVGNSKLCYNGSEYLIQREVVSAGFEEQNEN